MMKGVTPRLEHLLGPKEQACQPKFRSAERRLVRRAGIEPASQAWEAHILPMNYRRIIKTVKAE
jgi:hypothetical protein